MLDEKSHIDETDYAIMEMQSVASMQRAIKQQNNDMIIMVKKIVKKEIKKALKKLNPTHENKNNG